MRIYSETRCRSESDYFRGVQLIDTHIHLYSTDYELQQGDLIRSAQAAGVSQFLLPNIDLSTVAGMQQLVTDYPGVCLPMMGLHPGYVKADFEEQLTEIEQLAMSGRYYGIGEIGLDKYWDLTYLSQQESALKFQLQLAHRLKLPVALHTRNATKETIALIKELNLPGLTGVFHCFGGTAEEAIEIRELGFYLGIGGVLTFKNSGLDVLVHDIPIESIVLETDGPYLAPAPHRGKRNDPSYLRLIANKLAEVKNITVEEVAVLTSANARKLFAI